MENYVVWSVILKICGGKDIQKMGDHVKSFRPISRRKMILEQQSTYGIVKRTKHAFRFSILLRGKRTRETHVDSIGDTKLMKVRVFILFAIVTLENLNLGEKLIYNVSTKMKKFREHFRFISKRIYPYKMSKLIKKIT